MADVPMQIAESGHATVPVQGSFGLGQFVLDTGAEGSAVYEDFAEANGLDASGNMVLQGQTGASEVPVVRLDQVVLDHVSKGPIEAVKLAPRADSVPLAGIIGLDVIGDRTVDFDLPNLRVALLEPGNRPAGLKGKPVEATAIVGGLLTIPVEIHGVTATAVIDTGARKTRINWALGRLLQLDRSMLAQGDTIYGATNKPIDTRLATARNVTLGGRQLETLPVLVADLPVFQAFGVADRPAVILGLDWLATTRMVIDFPGRTIWFEAAG